MDFKKSTAIQFYNGLPPWAKGVVVVGGIAIIYFTTSQVISRIRKNNELKSNLRESADAQQELQDLSNQGVNQTLSNSEITSIINALVASMNSCGTDEDAVYNQFKKLNNIADLKTLIYKWGVQYYTPCAIEAPISYTKWLWNDKSFGGSISEWLNYDLNQSEIAKINKILSDKNINHSF